MGEKEAVAKMAGAESGEPQAKKCHPIRLRTNYFSRVFSWRQKLGKESISRSRAFRFPDLKLLLLGLVSRDFPCSHLMIKDQSQRTNRVLTRGRTPKELSHASLIRRLTRFGNHVPWFNIILNTRADWKPLLRVTRLLWKWWACSPWKYQLPQAISSVVPNDDLAQGLDLLVPYARGGRP